MSQLDCSSAESVDIIKSILRDKINDVNCTVSDCTLSGIIDCLDVTKKYRVFSTTNIKFMSKFCLNGYRQVLTETSDYIERYMCLCLYGKCVPGYIKGGRVVKSPLLYEGLSVFLCIQNTFGGCNESGLVNDDMFTLIVFGGVRSEVVQ